MNFPDLTYLFENQAIIELKTSHYDYFNVGDFVIVNDANVLLMSKASSPEEAMECEFLNKTYSNIFEKASHGKYFCQVVEKNRNILSILMVYDLNIKYESEYNKSGIVISALEGALSGTSISELNNNISKNYRIEISGKYYYVMGKHVKTRGNAFILASPSTQRFYSVTSKLLEELVEKEKIAGDEYAYVIDAAERPIAKKEDYSYFLYDGEVSFENKTKSQRMSEMTRAMVENKGDKFVRLWRAYADAHIGLERERKENAGILEFERCDNKKGYYSFLIKNSYAISNFFKWCRESSEELNVIITQPRGKYTKTFKGILHDNYAPGETTVECELDEEDKIRNWGGTIEIDISGAEAMYARRIAAFDAIQQGTSANPNIAYLLQGRTENSYSKKQVSDRIKIDEKIIKDCWPDPYNPTPKQREAIEMAISTPDFAIIQGPPGTGKTKVIKAIYAHFQSQAKTNGDENHRFLLTAYQRDATKILSGDNDPILDIPIIAYYGNKNDDIDAALVDWCNNKRQAILENNANLDNYSIKKESFIFVREVQDAIKNCSSVKRAADLLQRLKYIAINFRDASFAEEKRNNSNLAERPDNQTAYRLVEDIDEVISIIDGQIRNLNRRLRNKPIELAKYYVKRLPTSKEEWSDNGFAFCEHAIDCFENLDFISEIKECVQLLSNEIINETVSFKNISAIKMKLILALDQTEFMTEENKQSINNTILSLIDCMKQFRQNDREEIISDFASYLYPNSETLLAIKKYQQIIAATHQYSSKEGIEKYHDILVDEAARSCPADLMIPLACSENRVILVGDHEQLPQFVEDNVLNELYKTCDIEEFSDEDDDEESADFEKKIRRSMFQYLMDKCEQLTKQDPLHKRVIALDTQYRMPPVLGDLVARNFYKDIGLHNSDKPQASFDQSYPNIKHKNMVWINASKMGTTEDHNGSYRRKYEAEIIAKYVKEIVESTEWKVLPEEKKKEEIGVITFYSWQKEEIKEKLIKAVGEESAKFIEVGTVDSFQGKEFPIVFLSLVRTNTSSSLGFLVDENTGRNRQCVALSRAQKCLIIVGNQDILKYKGAAKGIPALIDFHKQCKEGRPYCEYISE